MKLCLVFTEYVSLSSLLHQQVYNSTHHHVCYIIYRAMFRVRVLGILASGRAVLLRTRRYIKSSEGNHQISVPRVPVTKPDATQQICVFGSVSLVQHLPVTCLVNMLDCVVYMFGLHVLQNYSF